MSQQPADKPGRARKRLTPKQRVLKTVRFARAYDRLFSGWCVKRGDGTVIGECYASANGAWADAARRLNV